MNDHADELAQWKKDNPANAEPKPEDLAGAFFASFSKAHPGAFPRCRRVDRRRRQDEKKKIQPVNQGSDIQGIFFDMWRTMNMPMPTWRPVPADMVMASGSGLDPHITLKNAACISSTASPPKRARRARGAKAGVVSQEDRRTAAQVCLGALGGLADVDLVNVLEVNLAVLRDKYEEAGQFGEIDLTARHRSGRR